MSKLSLLKLFIAGIIVICISVLGSLFVLVVIGSLVVPFVEWFESNPILRSVFALVSIILIAVLFLALSKWVLKKVV